MQLVCHKSRNVENPKNAVNQVSSFIKYRLKCRQEGTWPDNEE